MSSAADPTSRPNSPARQAVIGLLKNFYDEEVFGLLAREFYSADRAASLAAIESSGSPGNDSALPHLYRVIESGAPEQRLAAVRALAAIGAPSSVQPLLKYYAFFEEPGLKCELLKAANRIGCHTAAVQEVDRSVLATGAPAPLAAVALQGLLEGGRVELVEQHIATAPAEAQLAVLRAMTPRAAGAQREDGILRALRERGALEPTVLGRLLAVTVRRDPADRLIHTVERLRKAGPAATRSFVEGLAECATTMPRPRQIFRLALLVPYVDAATEGILGELLRQLAAAGTAEPATDASYFRVTVSTHIDTTFARIRKDYPSIRGVTAKGALLIVLLARLVERYASPELFERIAAHFQSSLLAGGDDLARQLAEAMAGATEEERNQLRAVTPLLATRSPRLRILVSSQLASINLDRPNLLRRLNRLVRIAGWLQARPASSRIAEILAFARDERLAFLEETCIVTLCQLAHRPTLERLPAVLLEAPCTSATFQGYLRGIRFVAPKGLVAPLARVLARADLPERARRLALDTIACWRFGSDIAALAPLVLLLETGRLPSEDAERLAELVAATASAGNAAAFLELSEREAPQLKLLAAMALRRLAASGNSALRDVLASRLYALLGSGLPAVEMQALLGLISQEDEYAQKVLSETLQKDDEDYLCRLLPQLDEQMGPERIPDLLALLESPRERTRACAVALLQRLAGGSFAEQLRSHLLQYLKRSGQRQLGARETVAAPRPAETLADRARTEFRFRRENSQILTVLFVDMVGYTERTSDYDPAALLRLIQSFEDIVLPQIEAFDGRLVKKMGDGILAVFKHPLRAALAALAIQAHIRRYNEFRVASEKLHVRAGLNTGLVVRKEGDVFGDVVNVASRMQTAANPGEILLTHATYVEICEHVKCTPLGGIQVKGKKEPIMAYVATEVLGGMEGMMGDLDAGTERQLAELNLTETMVTPVYVFPSNAQIPPRTAEALAAVFEDLTRAGEELTRDYRDENAFKRYLQEKWDELVHRLGGLSSPAREREAADRPARPL